MKPIHKHHLGLKSLTTGIGATLLALMSVASAQSNTKTGLNAGAAITTGTNNTAIGASALQADKTGSFNTAVGASALLKTTGASNVAVGFEALWKSTKGGFNVAVGDGALRSTTTGSHNIGLGEDAGINLTVGSDNICIDNPGIAGESGKIRIGTAGIHTDTFLTGIIHGDGSGLTSLPANSVTGGQIANAVVTSAKLAPGLTLAGKTTGSFSGPLEGNAMTADFATSAGVALNFGGNLSGDVTGPQGATMIAPGAVSTAELAENSITAGKMAPMAVSAGQVDSSQVQLRVASAAPAGQFITGINANGTVTSAAPALSGGGVPNGMKEYTTTGDFTVPTGIYKVMIEAWGAGGGGGGGARDSGFGGDGGNGGYSRTIVPVTPGLTYLARIGGGGSGGVVGGINGLSGDNTEFSYGPVLLTLPLVRSTGGGGGENGATAANDEWVDGANGSNGLGDPAAMIGRTGASAIVQGSIALPYDIYRRQLSSGEFGGIFGPAKAGAGGYMIITW